jgi:Fe-coproporphyrin III synthase
MSNGIASDGSVSSVPILVLHAHSRCNCRCVMCDIWKRTDSMELRRSDLEAHRTSFRRLGVKWVVLSGGEPLLNQDIQSLCAFFHEESIRITLLTSGLLLHRRALDVAESFDDIIISLDGPEEIHDRIRGVGGAFQMIAMGIRSVRRLRPDIPISARCTIQRLNYLKLGQTANAVQSLKLNSISFLAADVSSEAFNRLPVWPTQKQCSIALDEVETIAFAGEMESFICDYADDIASGFIAESPEKLRRIVRHFQAFHGRVEPQAPICNAPWVSAVMEADGSVRPCFFHRPIGNVLTESFESVINGVEAKQFRQDLDMANDPICRRCVCSLNWHV